MCVHVSDDSHCFALCICQVTLAVWNDTNFLPCQNHVEPKSEGGVNQLQLMHTITQFRARLLSHFGTGEGYLKKPNFLM